jgi:hypothetical protein
MAVEAGTVAVVAVTAAEARTAAEDTFVCSPLSVVGKPTADIHARKHESVVERSQSSCRFDFLDSQRSRHLSDSLMESYCSWHLIHQL